MSIKPFSEVAKYYDYLFEDVDYEYWAQYISRLFTFSRLRVKDVLEVGSGTGNLTKYLKSLGYNVVGLDVSEDMIKVAKKKLPDVRFYVGDARSFSLDMDFDAIVSTFDSLNNILEAEDLFKAFKNFKRHLRPGGILICDLNTTYAMQTVWNEALFVKVLRDGIYSIWKGEYLGNGRAKLTLTLFVPYSDNLYRKIEEVYIEQGYTLNQVKGLLLKAGFINVWAFDDLSFEKPNAKSKRITYVAV